MEQIFANYFTNILFDTTISIVTKFLDFYVERKEAIQVVNLLQSNNNLIVIRGKVGTGKTTILEYVSRKLKDDYDEIIRINAHQPEAEQMDFKDEKDKKKLYVIDNAEYGSIKLLNKILKATKNSIRNQIIVSGRNVSSLGENIPIVEVGKFNNYQLKTFVEKRLQNYDNTIVNSVYEIFLKHNIEYLSTQEALSKFSTVYNEILATNQTVISTEDVKGKEKDSELSKMNIFNIVLTIFLFIMSQRSGEISTEELKQEILTATETITTKIESSITPEGYYQSIRNLNIREFPSTNKSKIKYTISNGDLVRLVEKRGKWWFIQYDKFDTGEVFEGWVYSYYLIPLTD